MRTRRSRSNLRVGTLAAILAMAPGTPPALRGESRTSGEYEVKAAFLFHFAQFVEWPAEVFPEANSPLTYCLMGDDPFHGALEETVKGKSVANHAFRVQHLIATSQIAGCHILFITGEDKRKLVEQLASANTRPILLVGDSEHFVQQGGMIGFLIEDNKVRFEINLETAERAKLKISARLLLLAKNVIGSH